MITATLDHGGTSSPLLLYSRYIFPPVLFVFFLVTLTAWGILTSESSAPAPPPIDGIHVNGKSNGKPHGNHRRRPTWTARIWRKIASRFPGGIQAAKTQDEQRLGLLRKAVLNWLLAGVLVTFVGNAVNVILHALAKRGWWCGKDYVISTIALLFIYALVLISQLDARLNPTLPHLATWIVGLAGHLLLLVVRIELYEDKHVGKFKWTSWEIIDLSIESLRILFLLLLIILYFCMVVLPRPAAIDGLDEESTSLLSGDVSAGQADYGSIPPHQKHGIPEPSAEAPAGWGRRTTVGKQSWWEYFRGYAVFFPYLWPSKDRRLQIVMIICFVLVILQRGVNVLVPHQLGAVTDTLSGGNGPARIPWVQIALYIFYRFLQGNMGLLGAARSTLWIPIGQYSYQALSTSAFEHVHSLSLDFHLGKKTGEVLSALSKGNAINTFLEQVSFQVIPMLVDLAVAVAYFLIEFDAYYALIVAIVTFVYLYLTVRMAQWRADIRRDMVNRSREEDAVKNDSMVAYETVKYFNAEEYEFRRYRNAVQSYQTAEYRVLLSLNVMNVSQNVVFTLGLLISCFLSAYQVSTGQIKVGRFVSLLTYLAQLQGPLNFFGTFYRSIQSAMINSERMLELFKEQPTVVDRPGAKELTDCQGEIAFRDVHFSYDMRKPALNGLNWVAKPGTTTAFVGESGGGKTTVLRLLFRFYNIQSGAIEIDGQDVRDVTIDSLRRHIGVVPQDTVLFNETVMYNLKYANPQATDEMVYDACRAASIHEKIMAFPDGYNTRVGERGLRLSGGEKQRVAIARTILKNPKIILLDEATAALDSSTEQHIQFALRELAKGRTTLVIAHRLSTIVSANQILCLHEGKVAEAGTHEELLAMGGRYAAMWEKQIRAEKVQRAKARLDDPDAATPVISSSSSDAGDTAGDGVREPSEQPTAIPTGQNPAGGIPPTAPSEVTPKETQAADYIEDPGNDSSASTATSVKGKGKSSSTASRPGSPAEGLKRSESGNSIAAKWSSKGLRKALGKKGKVLHKRNSSYGGSGSEREA